MFVNNNKIIYKIFSFKFFSIVQHYVANHILPSTYENLKRISHNKFNSQIINTTKLINILKYDVEQREKGMYFKNKIYYLELILNEFEQFLKDNKIYLLQEEIRLSLDGLKELFYNYKEFFCLMKKKKISNTKRFWYCTRDKIWIYIN